MVDYSEMQENAVEAKVGRIESKSLGKRMAQVKKVRAEVVSVDDKLQEQFKMDNIRSIEREKAHESLLKRLEDREETCPKCGGTGETKTGKECSKCFGTGIIVKEANMRAIELVLKPDFPKTTFNLNAKLDDMSTDDLINMLDKLNPVK